MQELLPFSTKALEERTRKREEFGLRVKGTGVGQRVKGKWWERNIRGRLEKRRQAMLEMPQMIQTWKQVSLLLCVVEYYSDEPLSLAMVVDGRNSPNKFRDFLVGCKESIEHRASELYDILNNRYASWQEWG